MELTVLEFTVLSAIVDSEYMDVEGAMMIGYQVWVPELTNQLKGALASCVKKGYVLHNASASQRNDTVWLTKEGYEAYQNQNKIAKN